ncbi:diguanylate cyclase [uncultured Treponema sp.]|uniref:sensor domain-containing diguanylate cyclase n=1 Tax=uncultured Treponema sp. TaxID=162155 RepID=UPI0025FDE6C2|nr:diguanylate cyclase [uncultured Treponema sp.]
MDKTKEGFSQVAVTLIEHYDCVYYVDINTGHYTNLVSMKVMEKNGFPFYGDDFFSDLKKCAETFIHQNDLDKFNQTFDKELTQEQIANSKSFSVIYRVHIGGKYIHMRYSVFLCQDKEHVLCCLENIEEEFHKNEVFKKILESEKRMARFDELTGVRNKNAFKELSESIQHKLEKGVKDYHFGIIMCDMNDLKLINDTRGHSYGDEAIQRTSRMLCDIFAHSPIFRIGGDEFVIILTDTDYENREALLENLKEESFINKRSRSGPVVACGMAVYEPESDDDFSKVFERADKAMYENKKEVKSTNQKQSFGNLDNKKQITPERRRILDALFGGLCTVSGGGYVFLCDMHYDYSRWALPLVDDFGMKSEYMYHANELWQEKVHPDDLKAYRNIMEAALCGTADMSHPLVYRARKADGNYALLTLRSFVLTDSKGNAEYFGGIIIPM